MVREPDHQSLNLYKGASHDSARVSYWQTVSTMRFFGSSGTVDMDITKSKKPFGGFRTKLETGRVTLLHQARGECEEWLGRRRIGVDIAEKMLSVIPGTLGLPRDNPT